MTAPKTKPKTYTATYVGGCEGVIVSLPSGRALTFQRGETLPILANEHDALAVHPEFNVATAKEEVAK